ncbi:MAG: hypothetical protein H0X24_02045 [Ktedonobacterales bacterium]|nr:hypothetical protein [Ktedonobacterales bacterium]
MRNANGWCRQLERELRQAAQALVASGGSGPLLSMRRLCQVELALTALRTLSPSAPASAAWALLIGYPFPLLESSTWTLEQHRMVGTLRQLLDQWKSRYSWRQALATYMQVDSALRLYDVSADLATFADRSARLTVAANRQLLYTMTLRQPVPLLSKPLPPGPVGQEYRYEERPRPLSVRIPAEIPPLPPVVGHPVGGNQDNPPIRLTWRQLVQTAEAMEERWQTAGTEVPSPEWAKTLRRIQFQLWDAADDAYRDLALDQEWTIDGLLHVVGMVSAGKSTLMEVLAVHLAWQQIPVTLVLGDILNLFDRTERFSHLGIQAVPILGSTSRLRHIERLHRAMAVRAAIQPLHPSAHAHPGFRYLSSICLIDPLRTDDSPKPFRPAREPCRKLQPLLPRDDEAEDDNDDALPEVGEVVGCPLYALCPRRVGERDLVTAPIWLATPASLVFTSVPNELNAERMRMAELIVRRSRVVIVDEADHAQTQLDDAFSPEQILVGENGEAWLDRLARRVDDAISSAGRSPLAEPEAAVWQHALRSAMTAVNGLYSMLQQEETRASLADEWVGYQYFSEWALFNQLALDLSGALPAENIAPRGGGVRQRYRGANMEQARQNPDYQALMAEFNAFLDDRLGVGNAPLVLLARSVLANPDTARVHQEITDWVETHPKVQCDAATRQRSIIRLRFVLHLAIVAEQLDYLIRCWRQLEGIVDLDRVKGGLTHRPPQDYAPIVPDAPMGNVLGFQFLPGEGGAPGRLRFLRCAGVGRWLLLHLRDMLRDEAIVGPHTLLLSGTSWAGTSPHYHVQAPVVGILRMPDAEMNAIEQSVFRFKPLYWPDRPSDAITVSGKRGKERQQALFAALRELATPAQMGGLSMLERERDRLAVGRRRVLLLVGSYEEADQARTFLENLRPDWKAASAVKDLIPDDAEDDDDEWNAAQPGRTTTGRTRLAAQGTKVRPKSIVRGQVNRLADDPDVWLLIAPLRAIERGHNILNAAGTAAIGLAYFLVRPHPHPDDLGHVLHAMNRWAIASWQNMTGEAETLTEGWRPPEVVFSLEDAAREFRREAYQRWQQLLNTPLVYSRVGETEREALIWSQIVAIWQVVGRLIRGGVPATVFFIDAKFASAAAASEETPDTPETSLLVGMREVLRPYIEEQGRGIIAPRDRELVRILYGPFYAALLRTQGLTLDDLS